MTKYPLMASVAAALAVFGTGATVSAGVDYPPIDGTVTGHIYFDTNGNGTQDPGEPDLEGVTVVITDDNGDTYEVFTDADGNWSVVVPPGETTADVQESTLPSGVTQTEGTDPTTVTAVAGETTDGGIDGYTDDQGSSVITAEAFGHVYLDTNGNGTQDAGEPNLANVRVVITPDVGEPIVVLTDENGDWEATVPVGSATADIDESTLPDGVLQTEGTDPTTFTVTANTRTDGGTDGYTPAEDVLIPSTGTDFTTMGLRVGGVALAVGAGLLLVSWRRRRDHIAA